MHCSVEEAALFPTARRHASLVEYWFLFSPNNDHFLSTAVTKWLKKWRKQNSQRVTVLRMTSLESVWALPVTQLCQEPFWMMTVPQTVEVSTYMILIKSKWCYE